MWSLQSEVAFNCRPCPNATLNSLNNAGWLSAVCWVGSCYEPCHLIGSGLGGCSDNVRLLWPTLQWHLELAWILSCYQRKGFQAPEGVPPGSDLEGVWGSACWSASGMLTHTLRRYVAWKGGITSHCRTLTNTAILWKLPEAEYPLLHLSGGRQLEYMVHVAYLNFVMCTVAFPFFSYKFLVNLWLMDDASLAMLPVEFDVYYFRCDLLLSALMTTSVASRCKSILSGTHLLSDMMHFIWLCMNSGYADLQSNTETIQTIWCAPSFPRELFLECDWTFAKQACKFCPP